MAYIGLLGSILYSHILPIFLASGAGYVLGRRLRPDVRTLSRVTFYVFTPSLVFTSITRSQLDEADFRHMVVFTVASILTMTLLAAAVGLILRLDRHLLASLVVAAVFVNGGNYGLALNQFAFGDAGLARAVIYYTVSTIAVYTLGIAVASLGKRRLREVLLHGLGLPTTYALLLAIGARTTGWAVPLPFERAVGLLGQAAIPTMLILLGLQLSAADRWPQSRRGLVIVASLLQLVVAPVIGLLWTGLLGMTGPTRQAAVLETAMPTAVITTILAIEYDLDAALVSGTVVLSTLVSPLTLAPLIAYLQG